MKNYFNLKSICFLVIVLFMTSCESEDDSNQENSNVLLTINGSEITDNLWINIKGRNGEDLVVSKITNGEMAFENNVYEGDKIAVTIFSKNNAKTYLNVPRNKTIRINYFDPVQTQSSQFQIINYPDDFKSFVISRKNRFSPFSEEVNNIFSWGYTPDEDIYFSVYRENNPPYYIVTNPSDNDLNIFDIDQAIEMENQHKLSLSFNDPSSFSFDASITGLELENDEVLPMYVFYSGALLTPTLNNNLNIYTPNGFKGFRTNIYARKDDVVYRSFNPLEIPSTFDFIDPNIIVTDDSFDNFDIVSDDLSLSYTTSKWSKLNPQQGTVSWSITYPSNGVSNYFGSQTIPQEIKAEFPEFEDLNDLSLISSEMTNLNNKNYDGSIEELFNYYISTAHNPNTLLSKTFLFDSN